ncbi:PHP domain-containing protein [Aliikangiella sp. G2MR2-5]|uniref:PHP domain-containing protein n=1 Tax=Aliikangiella sp. G2MR2-5 TaxID=2788943 RepID=UPI0018A9C6E0|nr:PHP domain-containing protein [Aliikangiella sp. G2MR2-5]
MKYDFHCHSHFSDGALSPHALVQRAADNEITHLALTDHDSLSGLEQAIAAAQSCDKEIRIINGVEVSAMSEFGEVHIVGLGVDPQNEALINNLKSQNQARWQRAEKINSKLVRCGIEGVFDWLQANVVEVVTRTHIAKALVELEKVSDMQQAFKKFIGRKGRAKVAQEWLPLELVIELIHRAGGMAVLAHPTRYPLSNRKLSYLIEAFAAEGGDAIEMSYPSLNKDKMQWLSIHREKHNLMVSAGSDFHYPNLKWTDLGRFPFLDQSLPHVLEKLVN